MISFDLPATSSHRGAQGGTSATFPNLAIFISRRRSCAAPLAERQRRVQPLEVRPAHAGPHPQDARIEHPNALSRSVRRTVVLLAPDRPSSRPTASMRRCGLSQAIRLRRPVPRRLATANEVGRWDRMWAASQATGTLRAQSACPIYGRIRCNQFFK
jgi:hypothetical protein